MNKDKTPEVGDVWLFKDLGIKVRILFVDEKNIEYFYYTPCIDFISKHTTDTKDFIKLYKYLGKSKVNINDLFKTENEE